MHITIFTANVCDNDDLNSSLHRFCISSWRRLIKALKKINIDADIIIYDYHSKEMQEFKKLKNWKFKRPSMEANAFRFWMLSRNKYYLWLDWDIYIPEKVNINLFDPNNIFIYKMFCVMYNADNTEIFHSIFEKYLTDDYCMQNYDQDVVKHLQIKENYFSNWRYLFMHLAKIDTDRLKPIKWVNKNDLKNIEYYKSMCGDIIFFTEDYLPEYNHIVFGCQNDSQLINYIKSIKYR